MVNAGKLEKAAAEAKGDVDADGVPFVTAVADGGWSNRSYGHSYTAKSGTAVIIGKETKKLLFIGVRNKYCSICEIGKRKNLIPEHKCYRNWTGSSPAMEPDIIVDGFKQSEATHGIRYKILIGDGDSSVFSKIIEKVSYGRTVHKIECLNHLLKNVSKRLHKLRTQLKRKDKRFLSSVRIRRIIKYVRLITSKEVKTGNATPESLRSLIRNVTSHIFSDHTKCKAAYCSKSGIFEKCKFSSLIVSRVAQCINILTRNTVSIMHNETSNLAECFMHLLSKFTGGKQCFYGRRASFIWRTYGASLLFQYGHGWKNQVARMAEGKSPSSLQKRVEKKRTERVIATARRRLDTHKEVPEEFDLSIDMDEEEDAPASKKRRTNSDPETSTPYHPTMDYSRDQRCNKPDSSPEDLLKDCQQQLELLQVDEEKREEIERNTIGQRDNLLWFEERTNRLTASNFAKVCRRKTNPGILVNQLVNSSKRGGHGCRSGSMKWGIDHEDVALEQFMNETGKKVRPCGLFVDLTRGYLAASPDGVVLGENAIVEIKCPASVCNLSPADAARTVSSFCSTVDEDGKLALKPNHEYMFQIQGQLAITNSDKCYFIIWTLKGLSVEEIQFDPSKWAGMVILLEKFYLEEMLLEIVDSRYERQMPVRNSSTAKAISSVKKKGAATNKKKGAAVNKGKDAATSKKKDAAANSTGNGLQVIAENDFDTSLVDDCVASLVMTNDERANAENDLDSSLVDDYVAPLDSSWIDPFTTPMEVTLEETSVISTGPILLHLRNGHLLPPVQYPDVKVLPENTCSFDSIASLLKCCMMDYVTYADFAAQSESPFMKFCSNLSNAKSLDESGLYRQRADLLLTGNTFKGIEDKSSGIVHLNVECPLIRMLNYLFESAPSAVTYTVCTHDQCCSEMQRLAVLEPTAEELCLGIQNLEDVLSSYLGRPDGKCKQCGSGDALVMFEPGAHIMVMVDSFFDHSMELLMEERFVPFDILNVPQSIVLSDERYKFAGFISFKGEQDATKMGHFCGFSLRSDGCWEVHDNVARTPQLADETQLSLERPQVLMYTRM